MYKQIAAKYVKCFTTAALAFSVIANAENSTDAFAKIRSQGSEDEAKILLNPKDPSFNIWKQVRQDLSVDREPGLINVQRFVGHYPWIGIPTFFHLPVALTPADLKAAKVEVAIMGAELMGDPRARSWGPAEMRNPRRSEVYHVWGDFSMPELDTGTVALKELVVADYGDAPSEPFSIERSIPEIRRMVREIAQTEIAAGRRTIPIIVGGPHALMYPDVAGLVDVYGKGNVGVIHFDAHADMASIGFGHLVTHGNPIRALINDGLVDGEDIIQIGLRGPTSTDLATVEWARQQGLRYHMMAEVEERGWDAVMNDVLDEAIQGADYLFVSFDLDVVDPAFIPGTSTPEPGGLYMREAMPLVRRLCAEANIVGFELVELRPDSDPGYTSVLNAKAILRQCLNGLAVRKRGISERDYLHPKLKDDGR